MQPWSQLLPLKLCWRSRTVASPLGGLQQLPAQSWSIHSPLLSIRGPIFSVYSLLLLLRTQTHSWTPVLLHPPIPFPAQPCLAHPPSQPLPCSLWGNCRLWFEARQGSWADQVMDSAWSSGRAPPALIQAIMAQQNPSTCKCSPEVLGQRRCRGGFPWAQVSVLQEPGHSSRCAGSAEPRAGNHPCLASCLWKELPQSPGKSLHTLACVYTHTRAWAPVCVNHWKTWDLAELLRCMLPVRSQDSRIHYSPKNEAGPVICANKVFSPSGDDLSISLMPGHC